MRGIKKAKGNWDGTLEYYRTSLDQERLFRAGQQVLLHFDTTKQEDLRGSQEDVRDSSADVLHGPVRRERAGDPGRP